MKKFWTKKYPSGIDDKLSLNNYGSFVDLFNEGFDKYSIKFHLKIWVSLFLIKS